MQLQGRAHTCNAEDLSLSPSNQKPNQTKQEQETPQIPGETLLASN